MCDADQALSNCLYLQMIAGHKRDETRLAQRNDTVLLHTGQEPFVMVPGQRKGEQFLHQGCDCQYDQLCSQIMCVHA